MTKKILFYKSIIWQMIGMIWISLLSYLWFGDLIRSLSFTIVVMVVSIFVYVLYEMAWEKFMKKKPNATRNDILVNSFNHCINYLCFFINRLRISSSY